MKVNNAAFIVLGRLFSAWLRVCRLCTVLGKRGYFTSFYRRSRLRWCSHFSSTTALSPQPFPPQLSPHTPRSPIPILPLNPTSLCRLANPTKSPNPALPSPSQIPTLSPHLFKLTNPHPAPLYTLYKISTSLKSHNCSTANLFKHNKKYFPKPLAFPRIICYNSNSKR